MGGRKHRAHTPTNTGAHTPDAHTAPHTPALPFPDWVRALRAAMGVSQVGLAAAMGLHWSTVWHWENTPQRRPYGMAARALRVLAHTAGMSAGWEE